MPAVPTRLPARSFALADPAAGERDQRRQRLLHQRADGDEVVRALVAGEQQLGLVGDHEVGAAGAQELQRRGGVRRRLDVDVQPGAARTPRRPARRRCPRGRRWGSSRARARRSSRRCRRRRRRARSSRRSRRRRGSSSSAASASGRLMVLLGGGSGRPVHDAPLEQREQAVQGDGEREQQEGGGERAGGLELAVGDQQRVAEPAVRARPTRRTPRRSRRRRRRS